MDCPDGELSLVLVDDSQIATINQAYLHRTGPTNVIAFSMREGPFGDVTPDLLGDVVISLDTTAAEAREASMSLAERFCQLLVHGVLHLLGYEHEYSAEEAAAMENKSAEILAKIMPSPHLTQELTNMIINPQSTDM